jgi:hypothetical protein
MRERVTDDELIEYGSRCMKIALDTYEEEGDTESAFIQRMFALAFVEVVNHRHMSGANTLSGFTHQQISLTASAPLIDPDDLVSLFDGVRDVYLEGFVGKTRDYQDKFEVLYLVLKEVIDNRAATRISMN